MANVTHMSDFDPSESLKFKILYRVRQASFPMFWYQVCWVRGCKYAGKRSSGVFASALSQDTCQECTCVLSMVVSEHGNG